MNTNPSCFRVETSPLTFFEVTGADALSWLQGQLTNDVRKLGPAMPLGACMCSPTGQIVAILTLWKAGDRIILAIHNLAVPAVLERFDRMVIMEDIAISALPHSVSIILGPGSADYVDPKAEFMLPLDLTGAAGFAVLSNEPISALDISVIDDSELRTMEIIAGRPRFEFDTDAKTFPAELGQEFLDRCVSFEKGCYTGQEVVMRIHSRGHVNRRWVALVSGAPIETGAEIYDGDESIGKVLWAGPSIASGMVRNANFENGKIVTVGGTNVTLREMPLD